MGRPEAPIDYTVPELGKLAEQLRAMRDAAGLSYKELADRSRWSAAHLKRAASGRMLLDVEIVLSYAFECVSDDNDLHLIDHVDKLHADAVHAVDRVRRQSRRSSVVPKPELARDLGDVSGALRDAWARGGRPSARQMEKKSKKQLPRSTANVIANGHTVPKSLRQYLAFLEVCEVSYRSFPAWFRAWFKVRGVPTDAEPYDWMERRVAELYSAAVVAAKAERFVEDVYVRMVKNADKSETDILLSTRADWNERVLKAGGNMGTIRVHLRMDGENIRPTQRAAA